MKRRVLANAVAIVLLGVGAGCVGQGAPPLAAADLSGVFGLGGAACASLCAFEFAIEAHPWTEVLVTWDGTESPGFGAELIAPTGANWTLQRGFDAARVVLPEAQAGAYRLILEGSGNVEVSTRTIAAPASGPLLPNIVTMIPAQIDFGPCQQVERTEQGAERCLRLGNGVGNAGHGPLEVTLTAPEGALAIAGSAVDRIEGSFAQNIYHSDGSYEARQVGAAEFHRSHGHFHYDGFASFGLYPIDAEGLRGDKAAAGHKSGFCLLDWGEMAEPEVRRGDGQRADQACLVPNAKGWSMGVTAGWFDFYWASLSDQYIEASGVGDGLYELVSVADADDQLLELDETDNAASVLVSIQGKTVEVLEERGFYRMPADTSNL